MYNMFLYILDTYSMSLTTIDKQRICCNLAKLKIQYRTTRYEMGGMIDTGTVL